MSAGWFVTGTDTEVGKTVVAAGLVYALRRRGIMAVGMKPVASGALVTRSGLRSEDADALRRVSGPGWAYRTLNPYAFAPAVAPHLAAAEAGVVIELARIAASFERLAARADAVVVEGVGGWLVPLNDHDTVADLSVRLGLPVILVVGMRLGCINHALLTVKAIRDAGLPLAGWVANRSVPSMARFEENVAALSTRVDAPLLGTVPHLADCAAPQVAERLDLDLLPGTSPR